MLKGIARCISPDLLKVLAEMGHGDELVLADAHFPGHRLNARVLRSDGVGIEELLDGILPLFELDAHEAPLTMMAAVPGDTPDPSVEAGYLEVIRRHVPGAGRPAQIERFAFYDRARAAYAVLMTGGTATYGNLLLRKGVTPTG